MTNPHGQTPRPRAWRTALLAVLIAGAALLNLLPLAVQQSAAQQIQIRVQVQGGGQVQAVVKGKAVAVGAQAAQAGAAANAQGDDEPLTQGVGLDTDADIDSLMRSAGQFAEAGRYRDAVTVYQHILDQDSNALTTQDGVIYRPVRRAVEMCLKQLPPEGLAEYRLRADGQAEALLASAAEVGQEKALRQLVRRFFASSHGDEAAFELGGLLMDRHEFIGARRLFMRIEHVHPDPTVPRAQLLMRLAVANARLGDAHAASDALTALRQVDADAPSTQALALVSKDVEASLAAQSADEAANQGAPGAVARLKAPDAAPLPALPDQLIAVGELWTDLTLHTFDLEVPKPDGRNVYRSPNQRPQSRAQLVGRWEKNHWSPVTDLLMRHGRVYFKSHNELICVDPNRDEHLVWKSTDAPPKSDKSNNSRTIWINSGSYNVYSLPNWPSTPEEVMLFGDRAGASMAMAGDLVFNIEGRTWKAGVYQSPVRIVNGRAVRTMPGSSLAAVDVKTGKARWRFGDGPADDNGQDLNVLCAPLVVGRRAIVPVSNAGALWLHALSVDKGQPQWKTFLCGLPMSEAPRWAVMGMAVDRSELYLASGYGVIFAIDTADGGILWASRYTRSTPATTQTRILAGRRVSVDSPGWDNDRVIVSGDTLVVLPSDAEQMFFIDRRTGRMRANLAQGSATYCLGVANEALFVAGPDVVRCHDLHTGQLKWKKDVAESLGRGVLTTGAIYVPADDVKGAILCLDPADGETRQVIRVATQTQDPIGNLYSDGQRLYAVGMERLYALVPARQQMAALDKRVKAGDEAAILDRVSLLQRMGQLARAVEDLRAARPRLQTPAIKKRAAEQMVEWLLDLAEATPDQALSLIDEAATMASTSSQRATVRLARAGQLNRQGKPMDALAEYLRVAGQDGAAMVVTEEGDTPCQTSAVLAALSAMKALADEHGPPVRQALAKRAGAALTGVLDAASDQRQHQAADRVAELEARQKQIQADLAAAGTARSEVAAQVAKLKTRVADVKLKIEKTAKEKGADSDEVKVLVKQLADAMKDQADAVAQSKRIAMKVAALKRDVEETGVSLAAAQADVAEIDRLRRQLPDNLLAVARTYEGTDEALTATLTAARLLFDRDQFERAELVLIDLAESAGSADSGAALAARAAAADLHARIGWHAQARREWTQLAAKHGDAQVPWPSRPARLGELAKAALAALPEQAPGQPDDTGPDRVPAPPWKRIWHVPGNQIYRAGFGDEDLSQFLRQHVLLLGVDNKNMSMHDLATGKAIWTLETPSKSGTTYHSPGQFLAYRGLMFPGGNVMRVGHVGMIAMPNGLMAIGLVSGKELWKQTTTEPDTNSNTAMFFGWNFNVTMNGGQTGLGSGTLVQNAMAPDSGVFVVRALDAATGEVRWMRSFEKDFVAGVWMAHGYANILLNNREVVVCDRHSGRRINRLTLTDRHPNGMLVWTDGGVLYPTTTGLVKRDLPAGKVIWSTPAQDPNEKNPPNPVVGIAYARVLALNDKLCCFQTYMQNGVQQFLLVDVATGQVRSRLDSAKLGHYITQVAVSSDATQMFVAGYNNERQMMISQFDVATSKLLRTIPVGQTPYAMLSPSVLGVGGDLLPIIQRDPPEDLGNGRKRATNLSTVAFYRKADGQKLEGPNAALPLPREDGKLLGARSIEVAGDVMLIFSNDGIMAFTTNTHSEPKK